MKLSKRVNPFKIKHSYGASCQKAYREQRHRPQIVYEKDDGSFACMPYSMWKMMKPGRGVLLVEKATRGMRIGGVPDER